MKIKICGNKFKDNVAEILQVKPDYLGFNFYPDSLRFISESELEEVFGLDLPSTIAIFVNNDVQQVVSILKKYSFDFVQLHGDEDFNYCKQVKELAPEIGLIKVFRVGDDFKRDSIADFDEIADYYLFDTASSTYGGSGEVFDWEILNTFPIKKRFFLSGGLNPENISTALNFKHEYLYALDLNSGFESAPGIKDINLLKQVL